MVKMRVGGYTAGKKPEEQNPHPTVENTCEA